MLGRHHLILTVLTAAIPVLLFFDTILRSIILFGVAVGSLVPDSDSPDAMIFHNRVRSLGGETGDLINRYFAPFFPVFGYTTKYLIYKPSIILYRAIGVEVEEKHRGLMHSVLGLVTSTVLTIVYISLSIFFAGIFNFALVAVLSISYIFGYLMHLLEDSMTVSGIRWFYPFSEIKLSGSLRTTTSGEDIRVSNLFAGYLGALFTAAYSFNSFFLAVFGYSAVLVVSWIVFASYNNLSLER